jgi:DNA polymerase V
MDPCSAETLHQAIDVGEIWGVGRKHSKKLNSLGIHSVMDFVLASPLMIRDQFSVVMHRTLLELQELLVLNWNIRHLQRSKSLLVAPLGRGSIT